MGVGPRKAGLLDMLDARSTRLGMHHPSRGKGPREGVTMLCTWPKCDCKLKLAERQLYPRLNECPKGEEIKADMDLLALSHDLYQLLQRSPHVWESPERCSTLEQDVERMERILTIARNMYRRRCCAHT